MVCIGTAVQATRQRAATRPGGASGGMQGACARNTMGGGATHGAAWGVFKAGLRGAQGASPRPVAVRLCLHVQHERGNGCWNIEGPPDSRSLRHKPGSLLGLLREKEKRAMSRLCGHNRSQND